MVQDFRDMCQGSYQHMNGITALNLRLLAKAGYEIISVPYTEFSINDKLLKRVQYLEKAIKAINKKK
jgi:RAP domain